MKTFETEGCAEAIQHGPADAYGRCPWCGVKYTDARPRPDFGGHATELTDAYGQAYDPDWNALTHAQIADRYRMGMA